MATRRYGLKVGESLEQVTEGVGAATSSDNVELTVDLATSIVTDGGTTRGILKSEVLIILEIFKEYIFQNNWPPA